MDTNEKGANRAALPKRQEGGAQGLQPNTNNYTGKTTRRQVLKSGMAAGAATGTWLATPKAFAASPPDRPDRPFSQTGLVFPDTHVPSIVARPSPHAEPFVQPLFIMPEAADVWEVDESDLAPPPDALRHQRFHEFAPQRFYEERLRQGRWVYHPDAPYNQGTWSLGWAADKNTNGPKFITPGATYKAHYGEAIFVRRFNENPEIGSGNVPWTLPSFTVHLHNAHTASESDGIPSDYFNPGEFWDHHYCNILAGLTDDRETMSTLWYHDHRLDFTATNVYGGISGMYMLFDKFDSNNENDPNPDAWRLPSGEYDVPLILHDVQFDEQGQAVWDFADPDLVNEDGEDYPGFQHTTFGMLGDQYTVNRTIRPYHDVKQRKYRFRILNGGPSRLYLLTFEREDAAGNSKGRVTPTVLTNDGNFLTEPLKMEEIELWVANRVDIVIDFSQFDDGDRIYMVNHMEMLMTGEGPSGRYIDTDDDNKILQFRVQPGAVTDPSQVPTFFRYQPDIDFSEVRRERLFAFDYDNGLFTIDGRLMDPNRPDALIEQGSAEIWTLRNEGTSWGHPIHTHFEEFQIFEIDGKPVAPRSFNDGRKDVVQLKPGSEVKFFGRWRDFYGRHVMHCHNVVHEDHAMMIRWDIVPPGRGD